MTIITKLSIVIFSSFLMLLMISVILSLYAAAATLPAVAPTSEQPRPGTIMIVTFVNGTTKAIKTDSTNIHALDGGYFTTDSSVKQSQPLQSKTVSKTVVQQLVSIFVDVRVDDPPVSSEGCGKGYGYYVDDPNPICEPLDKLGQGPPSDQAFCAALGCPYNPPADSQLPQANENINNLATTPVEQPGPGELSAGQCAAIGCNPGDPQPPGPVEAQPPENSADSNDNSDDDSGGGGDESGEE